MRREVVAGLLELVETFEPCTLSIRACRLRASGWSHWLVLYTHGESAWASRSREWSGPCAASLK
eukprot:2237073-Pyramimonas_sp.AAC.1